MMQTVLVGNAMRRIVAHHGRTLNMTFGWGRVVKLDPINRERGENPREVLICPLHGLTRIVADATEMRNGTGIGVAALAGPDLKIEIEMVVQLS